MRLDATILMLAGLTLAYLLGAFALPPALILAVATLSIAVPVTLREAGWLRDQDELQRRGQQRGGLWAFLLILTMTPIYLLLDSARNEFAGRTLEAAVYLFALIYLLETRGPRFAIRVLLNLAALLAAAYGLSHLPDLDKLVAMLLVAGGFAATAFLAGRAPAAAATILLVVGVIQLVQAVRGGGSDLAVFLPTAVVWAVMITVLLRAPAGRAP